MVKEGSLWLPRRNGRGGVDWKFGISRSKPVLYTGWINNKILTQGTVFNNL